VSLNFESGGMHGIIGPEGAGKTTLLRVILGLFKPDAGTIKIKVDEEVLTLAEIRNKVTYMPQQQSLYPDLSIDEHLDFFKELYQINQQDYTERRNMLLNMTRLAPYSERPAGALSGGMYKKLGLMCALLRSPEILLLDEPTNGVDPISRREFWNLLYGLLDRNILILMTTSYMDEAERCSKVHLLNTGRVVDAGEPRSLLSKYKVDNFDALFLKQGSEMT
jgi:drug efflux transport system ATP-binding protein